MSTLIEQIRAIEEELHTLETATPRNSATVDRGGLEVVDEGSVIVASGGTVLFEEGGAAMSHDFSIEDGAGWQIGTERRGSSVVVLHDVAGTSLEVSSADSTAKYEEIAATPGEDLTIGLLGASMMIVQIFGVWPEMGTLTVSGGTVTPNEVIKSQKTQWAYSYMDHFTENAVVRTDLPNLQARVVRLSVNNVA